MKINNKDVFVTAVAVTSGTMIIVDSGKEIIDPRHICYLTEEREIELNELLDKSSAYNMVKKGWEVDYLVSIQFEELWKFTNLSLHQAKVVVSYSLEDKNIDGIARTSSYPAMYLVHKGELVATVLRDNNNEYFGNQISKLGKQLSHLPSELSRRYITLDQIVDLISKDNEITVIRHPAGAK